jgi:quercetin dioxygenase-like cupin family protein
MHRLTRLTGFVTLPVVLVLAGLIRVTPAFGADQAKVTPLMSKELSDIDNKEVVMLTVEYKPGQSSAPHRHNAHTFVYVLQGALLMGVKGHEPVRVEAGQTFYESPTDVHDVSRNASDSAPAKFLVFFVKGKGAPANVPAE